MVVSYWNAEFKLELECMSETSLDNLNQGTKWFIS